MYIHPSDIHECYSFKSGNEISLNKSNNLRFINDPESKKLIKRITIMQIKEKLKNLYFIKIAYTNKSLIESLLEYKNLKMDYTQINQYCASKINLTPET